MSPDLDRLAELVHRESGVRIAETRRDSLAAALARIAPDADAAGLLRTAHDPLKGPALIGRLLDEVIVKETFFMRDPGQLATIDWQHLWHRAHRAGDERVRVWSVACATGEEAYTLALSACEAFGTERPPVTILATDISRQALQHGREGVYREHSVRDVDLALRARYFREEGDLLAVAGSLRALVTFACHNLIRGPFPPAGHGTFHLILCRNVLIYFDAGTVEAVVAQLGGALETGGELLLGAADALCLRGAAHDPGMRSPPSEIAPARTGSGSPGRDVLAGYYLRGLAELERGETAAAVESFRRVLSIEPGFGLAAFGLGRAYDVLGDHTAARRSYGQALQAFDTGGSSQERLLEQVDLADVRAAIAMRLEAMPGF